jgi:hypothetical protein
MNAFKKGDLVQVLDILDERDFGKDAIATARFIGRVGRVVEVVTGGPMAVGNSPIDPLYVVEVPLLGKDGFWGEELKRLREHQQHKQHKQHSEKGSA